MKKHYYEDIYEITRSIPEGRVSTYGAIADYLALGSARMVGRALSFCNQSGNHDIPAHRVTNRIGELTGRGHFKPPGLMKKLLESEGTKVKKHRVVDFKDKFWHPGEHL